MDAPSGAQRFFILTLLFVALSDAQRTQLAQEMDSFFGGDILAAASVRRPTEAKRTLVAFPFNLNPRVVVRNRGQPPPQEPEPPAPPAPPPATPTVAQRKEQERRRQQQQQKQKKSPAIEINRPSDQRQVFNRNRDREESRPFSVPITAGREELDYEENEELFPPGMTVERFPQERHPPIVIGGSRRQPVAGDFFVAPSNPNNNLKDQQQLFITAQEPQQQFGHNSQTLPAFNGRDEQAPVRSTLQRPQQELENSRPRVLSVPDRRLTQSDRSNSHRSILNIDQPQSELFIPSTKFQPHVSNTRAPSPGRSSAPKRQKTSSFRNSTVGRSPPPHFRTTASPFLAKTPSPVITRALDDFFGNHKPQKVRPKVSTTKRITFKTTTTTRSPLPEIKPIPKAVSPTLTVRRQKPNSHFRLIDEIEDEEDDEEEDELSEDDNSNSAPRPRFQENPGINPQFVEFSNIPRQSGTTVKPTITIWKSTPKVRTIVHPPPLSVRAALSKQRVASKNISTSDPVKSVLPGPRRRVVKTTTINPDFVVDTSHSFEDVPRIGPRTRTVIRKIPTTPAVKLAPSRTKFNSFSHFQPNLDNSDSETEEDGEESEEVVPSPIKSSRTDGNERDQHHINAVTSSPRVLNRHQSPSSAFLPRTQHKTSWQSGNAPAEEPLFHGPVVDKFANRNRFTDQRSRAIPQTFKNSRNLANRRPIVTQKPPVLSTQEYLNIRPAAEVDNAPTEADDDDYEPALGVPHTPLRMTTPLQSHFMHLRPGDEDFPDGNSYEENLPEDDYEEELEPPPTTTTTTTRRPLVSTRRTRRPTTRPRPTTLPVRRKPSLSFPKPSTHKPTKATLTSVTNFQLTKPASPKETPTAPSKTGKCDRNACFLPYCHCGGTSIPAGLSPTEIPQIVLLTFDDAVNDLNWPLYQTLFFSERTNPNGCPILTTLYVSHEWTDYGKVEAMYAAGHEVASHSISHGDGAGYSKKKWHDEIYGQKEILNRYGGVKASDILGMRAPFLAVGGDKMFGMLHEDNFTYDSSVTILENDPPSWPYTLDYGLPHECAIPPCPTKSYPGLWELPMVSLTDSNGGRCSMADSCSYATTAEGVHDMLIKNFLRHYETNRAPLGLYYHSSWFLTPHRKEGFLKFLDEILQQDDVYFITSQQMIEWMRQPTPLSHIKQFAPWQCRGKSRPPACRLSRDCNISFRGDMRSFRTCGECPSIYPWVGKTNV